MKKILLTGAALMALSFSVKAQTLYSEDFNSLTVGNVSEDLTATEAGQGGIYTYVAVNGSATDFQIVANGLNNTNGFQLNGSDQVSGTTTATNNQRFAITTGVDEGWGAREEGNELLTVEYQFKSATVTGSTNFHRTVVYSTDGFVLGGFQYGAQTGELEGLVYYSANGQAGTYRITLADSEEGLIVPENTWLKLGIAIDPTEGIVYWGSPDILVEDAETGEMVPFTGGFQSAVMAGLEPAEFDFVAIPGTANTAASTAIYDDVTVTAVADFESWLSAPVNVAAEKLAVYPNPANDVINIASATTLVSNVVLTDLNGRTVKSLDLGGVTTGQVNISDLTTGVYMLTITSDKNTTTKKIVKN